MLIYIADAADCDRLGLSALLNGHREIATTGFLAGDAKGNVESTFHLGRRMDAHWVHGRAGYRCRHVAQQRSTSPGGRAT